jgi:hypothetical protein
MKESNFTVNLKNPKDTAEEIAEKLNTLSYAVDQKCLKGDLVTKEEFNEYTNKIGKILSSSEDRLVYNIKEGRKQLEDLRWHGGGGAVTLYAEVPSGLINSSNKNYTTLHTIKNVIGLFINGEFIHPTEYTLSGAGFIMTTALDSSLSGTGFTILYN